MHILSIGSVISGMSFGDWRVLLQGGGKAFCNTIAKDPDTPSVDNAAFVFLLVLLALYICGAVMVWRTLSREKRERLKHFSPENIPTSATPAEANAGADRICAELDGFPPLDNRLIADEMRRRILSAAALGPTDPQIISRLNFFVDKLNAAAGRKIALPGITTLDKHGCAVPVFFVMSVVIVALNMIHHLFPGLLILPVLIAVYSTLIAAAKTPGYMRDKMNNSYLFRLITGIHTMAGENIKETFKESQKVDVIVVTYSDGHKETYFRPRNMFVMMAIAIAISLLMVALSTYILIPLTVYFMLSNYLLASANTVNYYATGFNPEEYKARLRKVIRVMLPVFAGVALLISGFDFEAMFGTLFVLSPMLFIPEGYLSYFNSRFSVASVRPEPERSRSFADLAAKGAKYFRIVLAAVFCVMAVTTYVIVGASRFYGEQERIKKAKIAAREQAEWNKAEEARRKKAQELEAQRQEEERKKAEQRQQEELKRQQEKEELQKQRAEEERKRRERQQEIQQERERQREAAKQRRAEEARKRKELRKRQNQTKKQRGKRGNGQPDAGDAEP